MADLNHVVMTMDIKHYRSAGPARPFQDGGGGRIQLKGHLSRVLQNVRYAYVAEPSQGGVKNTVNLNKSYYNFSVYDTSTEAN